MYPANYDRWTHDLGRDGMERRPIDLQIRWYPFPETIPEQSGEYMIADKNGKVSIQRFYNSNSMEYKCGSHSIRRKTNIRWLANIPFSPKKD